MSGDRGRRRAGWVRVSRCRDAGLRRYASEYDAARELRRVRERLAALGRDRLPADAFSCGDCGGWHLTAEAPAPAVLQDPRPQRPSSRTRRQRWRRTLTVQLLLQQPWCPVRTRGCTGRASTIVPLSRPEDLAVPEAWLTVCVPCRDALTTAPEEG